MAKGICSTGHPQASQTALEILGAGGNAFDAAVGALFVSASVGEPALTSLGGGGFALASRKGGEPILYDFFVNTPGKGLPPSQQKPHFFPITVKFPGSSQTFNAGVGSIAVPGVLKGALTLHKELGRMPLKEVLTPAITFCKRGLPVRPFQAYTFGLLEPILTHSQGSRNVFAPKGTLLREGDRILNAPLASYLETLHGNGDREFYEGELATSMVDLCQGENGLLTLKDLSTYRVLKRRPHQFSFLGNQIYSNARPSFGGVCLEQILKTFEAGTKDQRSLAAALQRVEEIREDLYGAHKGTTHLNVADGQGNVVSITTSNGEGSGLFTPDSGIHLNNMMGEEDLHPEGFHSSPPGMRVPSTMSPTMVRNAQKITLAIGSGGSKRIRSALAQVLIHVLHGRRSLREAIDAPRMHWDGKEFQVEPGIKLKGLPATHWKVKDIYFGGVHGVQPKREAYGDPRRDGLGF